MFSIFLCLLFQLDRSPFQATSRIKCLIVDACIPCRGNEMIAHFLNFIIVVIFFLLENFNIKYGKL